MNNKGFTLIELLATIILLSIIMTVGAYSVIGSITASREKSYDFLISNVKTAAKSFYEECENSNIIASSIPTEYCSIDGNKLTISYKTLLDYGFLKSSSKDEAGNRKIENPKDNSSLNDCSVNIIKSVDSSGGVSYAFSNAGGGYCPTNDDYKK